MTMNKKTSLIKNTLILLLGKFSTQFISFLLLPIITTYLSTSEYGTFDLITTYIILLVPIITLEMELSIFRYLIDSRNDEKKKKIVISNCYSLVILIILLIILIFPIIGIIFKLKYWPYLLLMLIASIFSNILLQTCRGLGDNIGYSLACLVISVINIILSLLLLIVFKFGIYSVLIASIVSNLGGSLFLFIKNKVYKYFNLKVLDKDFLKEALKYSIPLVPNGLVWWIINSSDKTIITLVIGVSSNGIYSLSNKFSNIINQVYAIFNMSWTESVSLYINDKDTFLNDIYNSVFTLICSGCLLLINSMFIIFPILINTKFIEAYKYIPILIIASIFNMLSSNLSAIYIANKKTKKILHTTIMAGIINVVINCCLIKTIGLYAAAISTLIAFAALFILRYKDVQKYVYIKLNMKSIFIYIVLFTISLIIYEVNNFYLNIISLISTLAIVVIINRNKLISIYNKLLKILTKDKLIILNKK